MQRLFMSSAPGYVFLVLGLTAGTASADVGPRPPGRLVDLGGHRLHVNCTGVGSPLVVVENGLGDFSFDWILVQSSVSRFTRICTYDRAGYAWSDPGPKPRTFDQLNLELRDALARLGERGPLVLVGHSFGGPVVRNFATAYPGDVAGMVLVDSVFEDQRILIQGRAVRLRDGAVGKAVPVPHEDMRETDWPIPKEGPSAPGPKWLDPLYKLLPPEVQKLQLWAKALTELDETEDNQREWSTESFALMHAKPQAGILGPMPLIVLTRARGGYADNLDVPAVELDRERMVGQARLALLSTKGKQTVLRCGHNMEIEAPNSVVAAIREVVESVRKHAQGGSRSGRSGC